MKRNDKSNRRKQIQLFRVIVFLALNSIILVNINKSRQMNKTSGTNLVLAADNAVTSDTIKDFNSQSKNETNQNPAPSLSVIEKINNKDQLREFVKKKLQHDKTKKLEDNNIPEEDKYILIDKNFLKDLTLELSKSKGAINKYKEDIKQKFKIINTLFEETKKDLEIKTKSNEKLEKQNQELQKQNEELKLSNKRFEELTANSEVLQKESKYEKLYRELEQKVNQLNEELLQSKIKLNNYEYKTKEKNEELSRAIQNNEYLKRKLSQTLKELDMRWAVMPERGSIICPFEIAKTNSILEYQTKDTLESKKLQESNNILRGNIEELKPKVEDLNIRKTITPQEDVKEDKFKIKKQSSKLDEYETKSKTNSTIEQFKTKYSKISDAQNANEAIINNYKKTIEEYKKLYNIQINSLEQMKQKIKEKDSKNLKLQKASKNMKEFNEKAKKYLGELKNDFQYKKNIMIKIEDAELQNKELENIKKKINSFAKFYQSLTSNLKKVQNKCANDRNTKIKEIFKVKNKNSNEKDNVNAIELNINREEFKNINNNYVALEEKYKGIDLAVKGFFKELNKINKNLKFSEDFDKAREEYFNHMFKIQHVDDISVFQNNNIKK